MNKQKLICAITIGDPAGIGPEVVLKALQDKSIRTQAKFLILGNSFVLKRTAKLSQIKLEIPKIASADSFANQKSNFALIDIGRTRKLAFGHSGIQLGKIAFSCIQEALRLIQLRKADVLVTAPVNKYNINQIGFSFQGHTEYLARSTETNNFAMMLLAKPLKVTVVTRHIALKDVARVLTKEKILQAIRLSVDALKKYFSISKPKIGVCGLNPHSGEGGACGLEEQQIIQPAIKLARRFAAIEGPLPADSAFYLASRGDFDAVIAMYHDQGLIPFKMLAFDQGVNFTLGLPFIRTSPDHGTAYNIAGKNKANPQSMIEAIKLAVKVGNKFKY